VFGRRIDAGANWGVLTPIERRTRSCMFDELQREQVLRIKIEGV
jgi:hypothetical protein